MPYFFVLTQFRTENRIALFLKLLLAIRSDRLSAKLRPKQDDGLPRRAPAGLSGYWNAVSEKLLSLRECSRSIGISASFSIALMPMVRCCATCRL